MFLAAILNSFSHVLNKNPKICLIARFGAKIKIMKFGTKIALFGYFFLLEFENNIVLFETSTIEFIKNEFLTRTVNFSVRCPFSEGPSQGPGPLYKV